MKTKGFTLIELLAVIVILAIIALIAVPIIMDLISKSKKGAFVDSAYSIVKAAELTMLEKIENNNFNELEFTYNNGEETSNISGAALQYTGKKPTSGKILVDKEGNVSLALHDGEVCVTKSFVNSVIESTDVSAEDCKLLPFQDSSLASIPEVSSGMIPITWDGTKWVKADTSKEWFNYNQKKWANVVLVDSDSRESYKEGDPGMEIEEEDVLAYLVWIPRYRYQLFNVESAIINPISIQIKFEDKNKDKSTGMVNGVHTNEEWYTHPAFTFGSEEKNGFWIGKFETTGTGSNPTIKPTITALRSRNVTEQFHTVRLFSEVLLYGLQTTNNSHVTKNIEWGAMAYLSHSMYGIDGNIVRNNNSDYLTGCVADRINYIVVSTCENSYSTINGTFGSTTGNVYGIYDTAAGSTDFVMAGVYNENHTEVILGNSTFSSEELLTTWRDYIDIYSYGTTASTQDAAIRRILGDATSEVRQWYGGRFQIVNTGTPWQFRGGATEAPTLAGYLSSGLGSGASGDSRSVRVTIFGT